MRTRAVSGCIFAFLVVASLAAAQIVPIRTVPLAQGDQFLLFPSNNLGMGGVSIALGDTLLDPFVNPATGVRLGGSRFFTSPTVYTTSQSTGAGRSLPFAALIGSGAWVGGLAVALQQLDVTQPMPSFPCAQCAVLPAFAAQLGSPPQSHGNAYTYASLGRVLPAAHLSLGGSVGWARLRAVDGVALLYPQSQRVDESGHTLDLHLGLVKDWTGGRSLQALLLRQGVVMGQSVAYIDQVWDPALQQTVQQLRIENNRDNSATWGVDLRYRRPLNDAGWTVGWLLTANRVSNSHVPDYNVLGIARGAGRSSAADIGVGFSKTRGPGTFAIDLMFEPIASTTWGVAGAPAVTALGDTLPTGARTMVNRFRFANAVMRMGVGRQTTLPGAGKVAGFQLGLAVRAVYYTLAQQDLVQATTQHMTQSWLEWTPTWGLSLRFPDLELRYGGRVENGMGRTNGQQFLFPPGVRAFDVGLPAFFVTSNGPVVLTGVHTVTHQISLSLPLR